MRIGGWIKWSTPLILAAALYSSAAAEVVVRLTTDKPPRIEVVGISAETLARLGRAPLREEEWNRVLAIRVKKSGSTSSQRSLLGKYAVHDDCIEFTPRFPLKLSLTYRAIFDPSAIVETSVRESRIETDLTVPAILRDRPTVVDAIYPTTDVLPENQLKFYIHFSAPMSRGESYRHIELQTADGAAVEAPFLELAEELWDDTGQRLTLLLDPGRVKQDLKPNKDVGRALASGNNYTLVVSHQWRDATGAPLGSDHRKSFRVNKPDTRKPVPRSWKLTVPVPATRDQLVIDFNEPLDRAMLQHSIHVSDPAGNVLQGRVTVDRGERRWSFKPNHAWSAGNYQLLIDGTLEDLAGNSISRPFEVYMPAARPAEVDQYAVPFQIDAATSGALPGQ